MKTIFTILTILLLLPLTADAKNTEYKIVVHNSEGKEVGSIRLRTVKSGVELSLDLNGIPPGEHAVHFHQKPLCQAPDFKSAGPHFNPTGKKHGLENKEGAHAGDMLNVTASTKGTMKATLINKAVTLGSGANSLFAEGGTSIVIHATADDMKTDPAGNAGDRIACGVIKAP